MLYQLRRLPIKLKSQQIKSNRMLLFGERGKLKYSRRTLTKQRTNKLNPHMKPSLGIEPGPHWWEASALTTTPPLQSMYPMKEMR